MSAHLGLILHVQEGNGGLSGWFNNPASGASSTWWVGKGGALEQYVDADVTAWAQGNGNGTYNSVETEGYHDEALTAAQEDTLAQLYAWGAQVYKWGNVLAEAPGDEGFGWHGMGGSAWGGHTGCPGDVRKPRRAPILAAAFGPTPAPEPEEELEVIIIRSPDGAMSMFDGTKKVGLVDTQSAGAFQAAGIKVANISKNQYDRIPNA